MKMSFVAIFLPACISMSIMFKRNKFKSLTGYVFYDVLMYAKWVLGLNVLNLFLICIVLGRSDFYTNSLDKFNFSLFYMSIECVFAYILPYFFEIVRKYISVEFDTLDRK